MGASGQGMSFYTLCWGFFWACSWILTPSFYARGALRLSLSVEKLRSAEVRRQAHEKALGWTCAICQWCYPFEICGVHYALVDGSLFSVCPTCFDSPAFAARYQHYSENKMIKHNK